MIFLTRTRRWHAMSSRTRRIVFALAISIVLVRSNIDPADDDVDLDGFSPNQGDCNDHDSFSYPGNTEIFDGIDNDCNGLIDDVEICCDGVDNDLDGAIDEDCAIVGVEICCDGLDNDCDGSTDENCGSEICNDTNVSSTTTTEMDSTTSTTTTIYTTTTVPSSSSTFDPTVRSTTTSPPTTSTTFASSTSADDTSVSSTTEDPISSTTAAPSSSSMDPVPTTTTAPHTTTTAAQTTSTDLTSSSSTETVLPSTTGVPLSDETETSEMQENKSTPFYELSVFHVAVGAVALFVAAGAVMVIFVRHLQRVRSELEDSNSRLVSKVEMQKMNLKMMGEAWLLDWDDLDLHARPLSRGAYGEVFQGTYRSRWNVAVKVMHRKSNNALCDESEIRFLQRTRHRRLVMFIGAGETPEGHVFLCMEYMKLGGLDEMLQRDPKLAPMPWSLRLTVLRDVCEGVAYIHSKAMIHRDLKSSNILLENEKGQGIRAKVADFGMARIMDLERIDTAHCHVMANDTSNDKRSSSDSNNSASSSQIESGEDFSTTSSVDASMSTLCGTPTHMAPELMVSDVRRKARYSNKVDIYGIGVIMWEVLERKQPWGDLKWHYQIFKKVQKGLRPPISESNVFKDASGKSPPQKYVLIMMSCWSQGPSNRPTISSLQESMSRCDWKPL